MNENFQELVEKFNKLLMVNDLKINVESIVIYQTDQKYDGNLGGISGANEKCSNETKIQTLKNIGFCNNTRSLLSNSSEQIADLNSLLSINNDFNVLTIERIEFKSKSYDLFNGQGSSLNIGKFTDWFWSGSDSDGKSTGSNCNDWYSNSSGSANVGKYDIQTSELKYTWTVTSCNNIAYILCICY